MYERQRTYGRDEEEHAIILRLMMENDTNDDNWFLTSIYICLYTYINCLRCLYLIIWIFIKYYINQTVLNCILSSMLLFFLFNLIFIWSISPSDKCKLIWLSLIMNPPTIDITNASPSALLIEYYLFIVFLLLRQTSVK